MKNKLNFGSWMSSFLLNPSYIIRKLLYNEIIDNSQFIIWKVLDFWCWEKPYKDLFNYKEYIWLDFKNSWHDNAKNNIDIYWDGKKIPFKDNNFDSFISTETLEHVFNIDEILQEINRVLKKWWYWIVTIPFMIWEHEEPYDFARYTYFWIKDILEKNWFKIIKHNRLWNYYLTLLQLKRWYIAQIIHNRKNKYMKIFLNIILWIPSQIIINTLSLLDFSKNKRVYLNNFILVQKI